MEKVKANSLTGKLLICYNQQKISLEKIIDRIRALFPESTARHQVAVTTCLTPTVNNAWYSMSKQEATRYLSSDPVRGLSHSEWLKRLTEYGANVLVEKEELSFWRLLWEQFQGFMVKLMLGAAGVSFLLGEPLDAFTIIGIVLLEAVIGVVQEYRAEKSLAALKDLTSPTACVSREGRQIQVDAKELVPGDIILLEAGDRVPADARLMESANLG